MYLSSWIKFDLGDDLYQKMTINPVAYQILTADGTRKSSDHFLPCCLNDEVLYIPFGKQKDKERALAC